MNSFLFHHKRYRQLLLRMATNDPLTGPEEVVPLYDQEDANFKNGSYD
jgi:hypothetical protein